MNIKALFLFFLSLTLSLSGLVQTRPATKTTYQYATGVQHVWINGRQVLQNGEHTGALPGRALWGPGKKK